MSSDSKKPQTVGFRYYMGILMGLWRGPSDEIMEVRNGDRVVLRQSVTESTSLKLDHPTLHGGDSGEGGIVGTLDVMWGDADQPINPRLQRMVGGRVSAYRGDTVLFYDGLVCSMTKYPKPWSVKGVRILNGWDGTTWYPEKAVIVMPDGTKAMNPAHILVQCLTDRSWGRGLPREDLDLDVYAAAADVLYDEKFGLCLKWSRTDAVNSFMQVVVDHIGGAQFASRSTGKMVLRLIRDNYDPDTLPHFTQGSGLLSIEEDESGDGALAANEIVVTYRSQKAKEDRQVREKNLASIQSAGAIISDTRSYLGITDPDLARRIARRDLRSALVARRFKVRLDRRGQDIEPAMAFRVTDATDPEINGLILRAGSVKEGPITNGRAEVVAMIDVFGLPTAGYGAGELPAPEDSLVAPALRRLFELPYIDLVGVAGGTDAPEGSTVLATVAVKPVGTQPTSYVIATLQGGNYVAEGTGAWCPAAQLVDALTDEPTNTVMRWARGNNTDLVDAGSLAMINGELVQIMGTASTPPGGDPEGKYLTIRRACADTVSAAHAADSIIWFYQGFGGVGQQRLAGESATVKLLPRLGQATLGADSAPADSITFVGRPFLPYVQGRPRLNGVRKPATVTGALTVTWVHRDRVLQADQPLPNDDATSVGPDATTRYALRFYDASNTLLIQKLDIAGVTAAVVLNYTGDVRMELFAINDMGDSFQKHERTFAYTPPGGTTTSSITAATWTPVVTVIDGGEVTP